MLHRDTATWIPHGRRAGELVSDACSIHYIRRRRRRRRGRRAGGGAGETAGRQEQLRAWGEAGRVSTARQESAVFLSLACSFFLFLWGGVGFEIGSLTGTASLSALGNRERGAVPATAVYSARGGASTGAVAGARRVARGSGAAARSSLPKQNSPVVLPTHLASCLRVSWPRLYWPKF